MKNESVHPKRWGGIVAGLTTAIVFTYIIFTVISSHVTGDTSITMNTGWTVSINDTVYSDVCLSDLYFHPAGNGDVVTISTVLKYKNQNMNYIRFLSCHSAIKVYIDNKQIYTYGIDKMQKKELVGYGYHFIELPQQYDGKKLEIVLWVTEDNAFSSISAPSMCNIRTVMSEMITKDRNSLFIGIFLFMFGVCFLIMTSVMCGYSLRYLKLFQVALLSVLVGSWTLCNYHLIQMFLPSLSLCIKIEFVTLYLTPIPFLIYFYDDMKELHSSKMRLIYWILLSGISGFDLVIFVLQTLNLCHIPRSLTVFHIIGGVIIIYSFILTVIRLKQKKSTHRIQLIGIIMLVMSAGADLFRFNLEKYISVFAISDFNGILPVGVLVYILMLLITFCLDISSNMYTQARQEILLQQALTDMLTKTSNRRACEEEFDRLDGQKKSIGYGIISMDLNDLKQVNDTLGHDKGDLLIEAFAKCLKKAVHSEDMIGRMGGDEFVIVVRNNQKNTLPDLIERIMKQISQYNAEHHEFYLSAACGAAASSEIEECKSREIYRIADQRMYEHKREYKENNTRDYS